MSRWTTYPTSDPQRSLISSILETKTITKTLSPNPAESLTLPSTAKCPQTALSLSLLYSNSCYKPNPLFPSLPSQSLNSPPEFRSHSSSTSYGTSLYISLYYILQLLLLKHKPLDAITFTQNLQTRVSTF